MSTNHIDQLGVAAVAGIASGMLVGLGTGRAAARGVRALADRVKNEGLRVTCVSTSTATEELARPLGLHVVDFSTIERVDYLFDGADEVDAAGRMLKGGGGAMTRERVVAAASMVRVYMIDETKLVSRLGEKMPLPVEILPLAVASVTARLAGLGLRGKIRQSKIGPGRYVTDNGNAILDVVIPPELAVGPAIEELAKRLDSIAGVLDHGLFIEEAQTILIERKDGRIERRVR